MTISPVIVIDNIKGPGYWHTPAYVEHIDWLRDNLKVETWKYFSGTNSFAFINAEDATAFKLKFGL
jgi:hypothetical protein